MPVNKIKILFLDHTPFIGGSQIFLLDLIGNLDRKKFDIFIACSKQADDLGLLKKYRDLNIESFIIPFGRLKSFRPSIFFNLYKGVREIKKIVKQQKIDILFGNTIRADIFCFFVSLFCNTKVVWYIQDFTFSRIIFKLLKLKKNKIIFNSRAVANFYNENDPVVIFPGSDIYKKAKVITNQEIYDWRQEHGIGLQDIVVGYVGRLVEWKGAIVLIEAIELLINEGFDNIKCIFLGTGKGQSNNYEEKLTKIISEKGIGKYIFFLGYQENVSIGLSGVDVFCLPSIEPEPFGLALVEAMMHKIPVIATNIGGPAEILTDGYDGLLVRPNNSEQLSVKIKELIENNSLRDNLGINAYNNALKKFDIMNSVKLFEKIFLDIKKY
jgi:glycosyltransferase involved in cell wall biosynthesis